MFFQTVFEGFKIISALKCFQGIVPKSCTNARQSKLAVASLAKRTF